MAVFSMKIAGHTAQVASLFESTPQYFRAYLTEDAPEFSISVSKEHISFEQADLLAEALRDGFKPRVFTDPFLERAAIQRAFADFLFNQNILLLHGSAIAVDQEGFLFTAHSGTGKSTHTRLWRERFGDRAVMVNDDKPFLQLTGSGVILHGSPWSGKHGLDCNTAVPLKGICILERGQENRICQITQPEAMPMLQKQCYRPEAASSARWESLLQQLAQSTALWHMACTRAPEAARIAYDAMHK